MVNDEKVAAKSKGGRPVGWRKAEGVRKQHQLRAYDDEWEMIQAFARLIKHGQKELCQDFLSKFRIPNS